MKTLTVETNGRIEFNFNGAATNTDIADQHLPSWAVSGLNQIINQLQSDGTNYVHFEDTGYVTMNHKRRMGEVEIWEFPIPELFVNLEQMVNEYMTSLNYVEEVIVEETPADGN